MEDRLERQDIVEKRAKCVICGYELTYPEYITGDKCVFHAEFKPEMGLLGWLRFAYAEYRVMRLKLGMAKRGLTEHDFQACVGLHGEDMGEMKDRSAMDRLLKELRNYKVANG